MDHYSYPQTSLRSPNGRRKYLTPAERQNFIQIAWTWPDDETAALCLILVYSGCRISEALSITRNSIDPGEQCLAIRSLKKRNRIVVRTIPLPQALVDRLCGGIGEADAPLCSFSRTKAWIQVKAVMRAAGIPPGLHATPKGLRHAFGIHALRCGVPLNLVQRWLGHADIATTAIYADAFGAEERELAARMWQETQVYEL